MKQAAVVSLAIPVKIWALSSENEKTAISRIGIVASCVSVAFFAAPLTKLVSFYLENSYKLKESWRFLGQTR